jgi:hypothetical protein
VFAVPVDPAPFLSTVILASAALVATVGGLLIARTDGLRPAALALAAR